MANSLALICPPQRTPFNQDRGFQEPFDREKEIFRNTWWLYFNRIADFVGQPLVRDGLRAERIALSLGGVREATLFVETDTGLVYQMRVTDGAAGWHYVTGSYPLEQLDIPDFVATLIDADKGVLIDSTDYFHQYRWDGAALNFAPGDEGSGKIVGGLPNGGLWAPCDGGVYDFSQPDGTVVSANSRPLTGDLFLVASATQGTAQLGTRPTWESGATTDDEASHTHTVHVIGTNSYEAGVFNAVADQTIGSSGGSAHHHDLSDSNAQLKITGDSGSGLPPRIAETWFQRR